MRFTDAVVPREWATENLAFAEFRGNRTEPAPLTWAQQVMWRAAALDTSKRHHLFMNLRRTVPVSIRLRADLASVTRAIGVLVSRHGSLRTRVSSVDGVAQQETTPAGWLPLLVTESAGDGAEAAQALAGRLGDVAFDHAAEWPLRVGLVLVDGQVRQVVLVFSHSTVDAYAAEVVLRDLRLILLRGAIATPPGPQSVQVARDQDGMDRYRSERSVAYWIRQFGRLPEEPMEPTCPELALRLHRGVLVSSALDTAVRMIAAQHQVSVSAVLLAGVTALAAGESGREICGLFNMAHNRFRTEYANAVANLGQIGFCVLDLADRPSFVDLLSRVWRASLDSYRHAYYAPTVMRGRFEGLGYEYDTAFLPHYYFNDVRLSGGGDVETVSMTQSELRAEMGRSAFSWTRGLDRASWHLLTHVTDEPGAVGITLSIDTRFRPPESVEPFLRNLEELLVTAAFHDVRWPWLPR
ncbi:condensation domain-containing protein [Micromonospora sp. NPDC003197]